MGKLSIPQGPVGSQPVDKQGDELLSLTCTDMRRLVSNWMKHGPRNEVRKFWDLITGLRGPDSPSERPDYPAKQNAELYQARRDRKYLTVEVIRDKAFFGVIGGAARSHEGDSITLPPQSQWDHFDKHAARAAAVLDLKVIIKGREK